MSASVSLETDSRAVPNLRWIPVAAGILGGGLTYLGFFPANLGFVGWFCLVPLVYLVARPNARGVYLGTILGGLLFGLAAVHWVRFAAPTMILAWIGLALLLTTHFLLFVALSRWLVHSARWPLLLAAPITWTLLEYARAHIDIGFAWYLLGHTQHDYLPVIQIADLFGAYGLSFLLMLANVALYQGIVWVLHRAWPEWSAGRLGILPPGGGQVRLSLTVCFVLVAASLGYGAWRLSQDEFEAGPVVALVQGNVPQEIRNDPSQGALQNTHFEELGEQAKQSEADLIVFPETSFTFEWLFPPETDSVELTELGKELLETSQRFAATKPKAWNASLLLGINSLIVRGEEFRPFNSAILLSREGVVLGTYHKCCRVPFGEYLPFRETLPFIKVLSPYDFDYGIDPGWELTLFELPGPKAYRFAVLICYEDSVPHLARQFMRKSPDSPPHFFLNISNDGWFRCSEEHEQHLVAARFRAVETRRSLARAVNMGISAVIDGNGKIVALPGPSLRESKGFAAVLTSSIPIDRRFSLYAWWGDVLPMACGILTAVGVLLGAVMSIRKRFARTG
ncbi:MAG: apolipoprotein N-acyltransferase [Gemmatales bacterium]|nr:apolipoprotein N-acyltransferase [Gemmatales bacterium]MDW8387370.1 apolipoprotein N-acyltransferase [Gemmatales bacterium]